MKIKKKKNKREEEEDHGIWSHHFMANRWGNKGNSDRLYLGGSKITSPQTSTLAWKVSWKEEPGGLQSMGLLRVRHDWATSLSLFTFMHWRGKWQLIPLFLPGESQGWGSLVGCCLWGRTESDTTERLSLSRCSGQPRPPPAGAIFCVCPSIRSHHFTANRPGNDGNSDRLYFGGLQNHYRWWLQPWN